MPTSPKPEESFASLADRVRGGDSAAEEELVRLFQHRVRAFALANGAGEGQSEELVQETLWGVISALRQGRVQQPEQLAAFVWGTARNLLNDRIRLRARDKITSLPPEAEFASPVREQEEFERQHAARQAIATLEARERAVLMLSLVEGLTNDEIAKRLGILPDAVRQRKSRALKKLSELLGVRSQPGRGRLLWNKSR
ncbi:MAG TPA: sigma-70 family RNA polymerase sigma factor [Candidatus Solibacter sp.]|nr:sigma-70 family RNA polymerase sigma factor [Candidatus Solibacter sp.]